MIKFDKWIFPASETEMVGWMRATNHLVDGRLTYQYPKYAEALNWVKDRKRAVDVGAHIGLWSYWMAKDFQIVEAFEPMPEHRECFTLNVTAENVRLHYCALGALPGKVFLKNFTMGASGDTGISTEGTPAEMQRLDEFAFKDVSLLKIDCEGYELHVLKGAEDTLRRCKPCVVVEQKPRVDRYGLTTKDGVMYLESLGAKLRASIVGDYILSWD